MIIAYPSRLLSLPLSLFSPPVPPTFSPRYAGGGGRTGRKEEKVGCFVFSFSLGFSSFCFLSRFSSKNEKKKKQNKNEKKKNEKLKPKKRRDSSRRRNS
jgi:hypothetical protein